MMEPTDQDFLKAREYLDAADVPMEDRQLGPWENLMGKLALSLWLKQLDELFRRG